MTTATIQINQHLAAYCKQYAVDGVVVFPKNWDITNVIADLLSRRPAGAYRDIVGLCDVGHSSITIALPDRHSRGGKNPLYYNYLNATAQHIIKQRIEKMFWQHVHDIMYEEKDQRGIDYINTAYAIIEQWGITGISVDAIIKHYYRYRQNLKKNRADFHSLKPKFCPLY